MTQRDFDTHFEQFTADQRDTLTAKGKDYAPGDDKFANFKNVAAMLGVPVVTVAMVYFLKHVESLCTYAKTGKATSEPIQGRLLDAANYAAIMSGIVRELEAASAATKGKETK